ncbi:MAG: MarR family winged helix-turn-helix transcriptional regulator [Planctomycetota bacterium]
MAKTPQTLTIDDSCFAMRARLLSRVVTGIYDEATRPLGVKASQITLLAITAHMGVARPSDVCEVLHMDASTLSRNVERMRKSGWLEVVPGEGRSQPFQLTDAGWKLLKKVEPLWKKAQQKARTTLGKELADALSGPLAELRPTD